MVVDIFFLQTAARLTSEPTGPIWIKEATNHGVGPCVLSQPKSPVPEPRATAAQV